MSENIDTRFMGKEFLTEFIEIYKSHPALWKTKSAGYANKNLKKRGYEALVEYSKKVYPNADRAFVYKKIQNMRGCFRKELKKVLGSQRTEAGTDHIYEPRLWYYDLLLFTSHQEVPVESRESLKLEIQDQSQQSEEESEEYTERNERGQNTQESVARSFRKSSTPKKDPLLQKPPSKEKRKLAFQKNEEEFTKTCTQVIKQNNDIPDEFEAVGINVAAKLRKMDSMQQILAETLINKILIKGVLKELTRSTDITDNSVINAWQTNTNLLNNPGCCSYYSSSSATTSPQPSPNSTTTTADIANPDDY